MLVVRRRLSTLYLGRRGTEVRTPWRPIRGRNMGRWRYEAKSREAEEIVVATVIHTVCDDAFVGFPHFTDEIVKARAADPI